MSSTEVTVWQSIPTSSGSKPVEPLAAVARDDEEMPAARRREGARIRRSPGAGGRC